MSPIDILKTASHLAAIYSRVVVLRASEPPTEMSIAEAMAAAPLSSLERVNTAADGLNYTARIIGETLIMAGGMELLHAVYGEVEAFGGDGRLTAWLDHRWDGLSDGRAIWVA